MIGSQGGGRGRFLGFGRSSSPGEFHPEALTDPCVNLSIHTALHSRSLLSVENKPFLEVKGSSWLPSWPNLPSSYVILFAPRPLQTLRRYYRMIRHLQVHRVCRQNQVWPRIQQPSHWPFNS